jgi:hypothetical protein
MDRYWELRSVNRLRIGDVLAHQIYDPDGRLLLRSGAVLDDKRIASLRRFSIRAVYILSEAQAEDWGRNFHDFCDPYPRQRKSSIVCCGHAGLDMPTRDRPCSSWLCHRCGCIYFGVARGADQPTVEQAWISTAAFDIPIGPVEVIEVPPRVKRMLDTPTSNAGIERRRHRRFPISMSAVVAPVDASFRIAGEAVQLETRDVSQGGISFRHRRAPSTPYLYIVMALDAGSPLRMVANVVRVRRIGSTFDVGCQWYSRVVSHSVAPWNERMTAAQLLPLAAC